jgi:AAHS family 4-hydroxybenzoate transporter-like MFS transporter
VAQADRDSGSALHFGLILLALVVEGFDLQAANFAAPDVLDTFNLERTEAGPFLSASLVGVLVGAAFVGPLGDRFGRKRVIVACCFGYGFLSLIAAGAQSFTQLVVLRFFIGIGLGGVLPNALALAGELATPAHRARAMGMVGIGITLGGVVAGLVAAWLIPTFGWQALFVAVGVLPVLALVLWSALPESTALQVERASRDDPAGVRTLFEPGMAARTIAVWLIFASVLMCVYLLSGWIPLLMEDSGFSAEQAAFIGSAYHAGGVVGGVIASLLLSRRNWTVVVLFAGAAAATLAILGAGEWSTMTVMVLIVLIGLLVTGTQNAINGAGGDAYPTHIRATGLGWALGIGRLGSIAGPLVGSLAIALGLSEPRHLFFVPVLPMLIAALAAAWLAHLTRSPAPRTAEGTA